MNIVLPYCRLQSAPARLGSSGPLTIEKAADERIVIKPYGQASRSQPSSSLVATDFSGILEISVGPVKKKSVNYPEMCRLRSAVDEPADGWRRDRSESPTILRSISRRK